MLPLYDPATGTLPLYGDYLGVPEDQVDLGAPLGKGCGLEQSPSPPRHEHGVGAGAHRPSAGKAAVVHPPLASLLDRAA